MGDFVETITARCAAEDDATVLINAQGMAPDHARTLARNLDNEFTKAAAATGRPRDVLVFAGEPVARAARPDLARLAAEYDLERVRITDPEVRVTRARGKRWTLTHRSAWRCRPGPRDGPRASSG